jgi:hypothetical protein
MVSKQESQVIKKIIFKFNSYQNYLHETSAMISITHPKAPQEMFLIPEEEPSEAFSAPRYLCLNQRSTTTTCFNQ